MSWRHGFLTCFTFTILLVGMRSILCCVEGNCVLAALLIIVAAVLDGLDGTLARKLGGATDFGARLDTYVDTVCFGVAPGVLLYRAMASSMPLVATGLAFFAVSVGVLRFTRGCEMEDAGPKHVFRGLPIPIPAVWISLLILATLTPVLGLEATGVAFGLVSVLMWIATALFLFLEVSNVRYEKPRREAVIASLGLLVVFALLGKSFLFGVVIAGVACMLVYVFSGLLRHVLGLIAIARDAETVSAGR